MMAIPSDLKAARKLERKVLSEVSRCGYSEVCAFAIRLALEEALNNAIKHGNGLDPRKTVHVEYDINEEQAVFVITDEGCGFNPHAVPDPTADENLEKPSGRGIMLMRAYMDVVQFNDCGNQVRMVKKRA
ncbi:MAG: ATP-binding protein [Phycisphaerae bacterium]|jgi:serine/threonine-protein kinase RsbW